MKRLLPASALLLASLLPARAAEDVPFVVTPDNVTFKTSIVRAGVNYRF